MLIETECPKLPPKERLYDYGGTDVSCILGANKYKSKFQYWLEKTKKVEPEDVQGDAVYFGVQQENQIVEEFRTRFKVKEEVNKSVKVSLLMSDELRERAKASGITLGGECDAIVRNCAHFGCDVIVEAKTANSYSWKENFQNGKEIPIYYDTQGAFYCGMTGIRTVIFCILTDGKYYFIRRDYTDAECKFAMDAVFEFHNDHILNGEAPPIDGGEACTEFIKDVASKIPQGSCSAEDFGIEDNIKSLFEIKKQIKDLEVAKNENENKIKAAIDNFQECYSNEFKLTYKPRQDSISLDTVAIKVANDRLYNDLVSKYGKTRSGGRPLLIKEI